MSKNKTGFAAIVGRPNVGKSTLLNRLVGQKLAGVSPKPQTTRESIRGIYTEKRGQIIFLDTPGLHDPKDLLGSWMIREIRQCVEGADLIYWMVLPGRADAYDEKILKFLEGMKVPVFLLVNQIDRYPKPEILPVLDHYQNLYSFRELIPISAKMGLQVDLLLEKSFEHLPEGDPLFPEDQISDHHERFHIGEIIREKIFRLTSKEVPYDTTIIIEEFKERNENFVDIRVSVIVNRDSQKKIIIGKQGKKLKQIGQVARYEIEEFLGKRVYLELWVKTLYHWKQNKATLRRLGYE